MSNLPPDCFVCRGSISPCEYFLTGVFHGEALLAPRPTPKLEDHPSSAVRDCLFNIFAATLLIGGRSSIRNLRTRHAVVTGTLLYTACHIPSRDKHSHKLNTSNLEVHTLTIYQYIEHKRNYFAGSHKFYFILPTYFCLSLRRAYF